MSPEKLQWLTLLFNFLIAGAGVAGLVWGFMRWVWPRIIHRFPVLVALKALPAMQAQLQQVHHQVMPNNGSSMADSLKRVEDKQAANHDRIEKIGAKVDDLQSTMRVSQDNDPRKAVFQCDARGWLVDATKTYIRWTGRTLAELRGWGWLNAVHAEDREFVREEWIEAFKEGRASSAKFRIRHIDGDELHVEATATPVPEGVAIGEIERWVGVMYVVGEQP